MSHLDAGGGMDVNMFWLVPPRSDPRTELPHMAAQTKTDFKSAGSSLRRAAGAGSGVAVVHLDVVRVAEVEGPGRDLVLSLLGSVVSAAKDAWAS